MLVGHLSGQVKALATKPDDYTVEGADLVPQISANLPPPRQINKCN